MRKYVTEFIGALFLTLVIALTGNPLAIGAILIALVYMGGYISGAYYNPALALAAVLRGKLSFKDLIFYIIVQILGGALAAVIYFALTGIAFVPAPAASIDFFMAMLIEMVGTFIFAYVVLHVVTSEETEGNQYYGFAIGMTLLAIVSAGGALSGGIYNPAVATGSILVNLAGLKANLSNLAMYIIGPLVGGALAAMVYKMVNRVTAEIAEESTIKIEEDKK